MLLLVYFSVLVGLMAEGQLVDSNSTNLSLDHLEIPACNDSLIGSAVQYYYYESNSTHINNERQTINLTFRYQPLTCKVFVAFGDEIIGFIYNGSFIGNILDAPVKIYSPTEYCFHEEKGRFDITIQLCENDKVVPSTITTGQIYFPCLIVSTVCYIFSAVVYKFILNVKDVHKKCFIGYCVSMAITFFFLILLQKLDTGCEYLGSIFFVFILSSFVWLFCLCLDMVYLVRTVTTDDRVMTNDAAPERLYLYIAGSILIPCLILLISLLTPPRGMPDVPKSFMKDQGTCPFTDTRIAVVFTPIGLLLVLSIMALMYTFYLIRVNDKKYKTDINWLDHNSQLKYMCYQCMVVIITMSIFFLLSLTLSSVSDPEIYETGTGMLFSLEIIDSLQGLFILSVFVVHYLLRGLQNKIKCDNPEGLPLNSSNGELAHKTRSCVMILIPSVIWIIDAICSSIFENMVQMNLVNAFIEGSQGLFVVAVFVTNRYTRKKLYKIFKRYRQSDETNSNRFPRLRKLFKDKGIDDDSVSSVRSDSRVSRFPKPLRTDSDISSSSKHSRDSRFSRLLRVFRTESTNSENSVPEELSLRQER